MCFKSPIFKYDDLKNKKALSHQPVIANIPQGTQCRLLFHVVVEITSLFSISNFMTMMIILIVIIDKENKDGA